MSVLSARSSSHSWSVPKQRNIRLIFQMFSSTEKYGNKYGDILKVSLSVDSSASTGRVVTKSSVPRPSCLVGVVYLMTFLGR